MKKISVSILLALALMTSLVSCLPSLEPEGNNSSLEVMDGHRLSTFYTNILWNVDSEKQFKINLIQLRGNRNYELDVICEIVKKRMKVSISIPADKIITDGEYIITSSAFKTEFIKRYKVRFEDEMVTFIDDVVVNNYSDGFNGSGTEFSPYIIATAKDLEYLFFCLSGDDTDGAGIYFQQIEDISWSSGGLEKRALGSESFAGKYDGGGNSISHMSYIGSGNENDSYIGMFSRLSNGAVIKNLIIDDISIQDGYNYIGAVTGYVNGDVSLENVTVSGSVEGNSSIGGLIGCAIDPAVLTVKECKLNIRVDGDFNIGGIIGDSYRADVTILNTTTVGNDGSSLFSDRFLVKGATDRVGGVMGHSYESELLIDGLKLYHSTNINNSDISILSAPDFVGGIVGHIITGKYGSFNGNTQIKNTDVVLTVKADNKCVGGYFGETEVRQNTYISISDSKLTALVEGKTHVGGVSGLLSMDYDSKFELDGFYFGSSSVMESPYGIKGDSMIGGLFGEVTGDNSDGSVLSLKDVSVEANVTSAHNTEDFGYVGGVAGKVTDSALKLANCKIGSGTMEVKGPYKVGGLIGELVTSDLDSDNNYDIHNSSPVIPSKSALYPNFNGKVKPYDQNASIRFVGGGVGMVDRSTVNGLHIKGDITGTKYTGGVFGQIYFKDDITISDCSFQGDVVGQTYTGGIAGEIQNRGKLSECINYGTVIGSDNVGGVAGKMYAEDDEPYVTYCVNVGNVSGVSEIGGVVGLMADGGDDWCRILYSANYGTVTGSTTTDFTGVGGILGESTQTYTNVQYCVNFGHVKGSGTSGNVCVGGISGKIGDASPVYSSNVSLRECANYGKVESASNDSYVGGITGYLEEGRYFYKDNSIVENCYNSADIDQNTNHDAGGIVGCMDNNCLVKYSVNYGKLPYGNGIIGTGNSDEGDEWDYSDIYTLEGTYKSGSIWPKGTNVFYAEEMGSDDYWTGKLDLEKYWIIRNGRPELRTCPFQYTKAPIQ